MIKNQHWLQSWIHQNSEGLHKWMEVIWIWTFSDSDARKYFWLWFLTKKLFHKRNQHHSIFSTIRKNEWTRMKIRRKKIPEEEDLKLFFNDECTFYKSTSHWMRWKKNCWISFMIIIFLIESSFPFHFISLLMETCAVHEVLRWWGV